jgi:hypothetical protein
MTRASDHTTNELISLYADRAHKAHVAIFDALRECGLDEDALGDLTPLFHALMTAVRKQGLAEGIERGHGHLRFETNHDTFED